MKEEEKQKAIELRRKGLSIKKIAKEVSVSQSTVSLWVRDVELTPLQKQSLMLDGFKSDHNTDFRNRFRKKRMDNQTVGFESENNQDPFYTFICGLLWGECTKSKNRFTFVNGDVRAIKQTKDFLDRYFQIEEERYRVSVQIWDELTIEESKKYWLGILNLTDLCWRKPTIKPKGKKNNNKYPMGICRLEVSKSSKLIQEIYGSIKYMIDDTSESWL